MHHSNHEHMKVALWIAGVGLALFLASVATLSARNLPSLAPIAPSCSQASPQSQRASNPNLAGHWTLNKDQSDDPHQKMQEAMGSGAGRGNGGEGGEGGGGSHRGEGRPGHGPGGMMNDMQQLTIEQTDKSVKVTGASGRVLAAYPQEQRESKPSSGENGENEAHEHMVPLAKWQGAQLVATNEGGRGSMTRTYELSSDGKQLIVTTKMQNPRMSQPVTIRLVYDATKSAPGSGN